MFNAYRFFVFSLWLVAAAAADTFRGTKSTPDEVRATGGFICSAISYNLVPFYSIYHHVGGDDGMQFRNDDGLISTSRDPTVAMQHIPNARGSDNYLYRIAPTRNFIDSTATMQQLVEEGGASERVANLYYLFRDEQELSAMHSIPWAQIKSWTRVDGTGRRQETVSNPDYDRRFDSQWDGGPQENFIGVATGPALPGHPSSRDPDPEELSHAASRYFRRIRFHASQSRVGRWT